MITNMLQGVVERGTARKARGAVRGTAIAGKTGTSRDGWFVGYSPNLVCVVWIGFDDNKQLGLTGAEAALPAWVDFMNDAVAMRPDLGGENFECPAGIEFVEIDSATGLRSTCDLSRARVDCCRLSEWRRIWNVIYTGICRRSRAAVHSRRRWKQRVKKLR